MTEIISFVVNEENRHDQKQKKTIFPSLHCVGLFAGCLFFHDAESGTSSYL